MNSVFGNLGIAGLAVALTALLILGTKATAAATTGKGAPSSGGGRGKLKPLGWTPCLILGMLAGSCYGAAGGFFTIVPDLAKEVISLSQSLIPGIGMGAIALTLAIIIGFKKLTTRQVAVLGILFWYVASQSGGVWSTVADAVATLGHRIS